MVFSAHIYMHSELNLNLETQDWDPE